MRAVWHTACSTTIAGRGQCAPPTRERRPPTIPRWLPLVETFIYAPATDWCARRRAEEIYESIKQQCIDPGLLQQGEGDEGEARRRNLFIEHIVPIPHFCSKRIEIGFLQSRPGERFRPECTLPLRPGPYCPVTA